MSETLVIAHGLVVNSNGRQRAHVVLRDGKISEVVDASSPVPTADRLIDATGRIVIPGGVDAHCHIAQQTGPHLTTDSYAITTAAALAGGTTTVMDFGIPADSTQTPLQAAEYKLSLVPEARCDVALHSSVITWDETVPDQLNALADRGIRSVKLYATNRGTTMADGDTMVKVLREMARIDGLTFVHAEHDEIIVDCTERHADIGEVHARDLPFTRPILAEEASVREVLAMAEYAGAAVYFVHQSSPGAVDLVTAAQARGLPIYSETCPHYVALSDEVYNGPRPEFFACCPPMRDKETMLALRERLTSGAINTVASDHSSYDLAQKRSHIEDLRLMPHGLPGVETRLPVTYSHMVEGDLSGLESFVAAFATFPARINGLRGKGSIAPGFDADVVLIDPEEFREVAVEDLHMGTDFSPFERMNLRGWPHVVISGGTVVFQEGQFIDPGPVGRFLKQHPFSEATAWPELGLPGQPE
ncbi:dihydropyrimidinase [Brevibacterium antiquum]|uniref:amidohydrolase family protein n=1 Tax=Brevibacterium antiquum TaxID=234835 RepID=UPI0018DFFBEF|nr:amidohydrolase family protein [Brevibacterium antiquum]